MNSGFAGCIASAVFPKQRMNFGNTNIKGNIIIGPYAWIRLKNSAKASSLKSKDHSYTSGSGLRGSRGAKGCYPLFSRM